MVGVSQISKLGRFIPLSC